LNSDTEDEECNGFVED